MCISSCTVLWKRKREPCGGKKKRKCGDDGWGQRNKIWRGGWYLGWDGNISLLFSSLLSRPVYISIYFHSSPRPAPESPARAPGGPLRSPSQHWRDGAFIPCTTSRSMGLFWQDQQQWIGIITVALQRELAEMKLYLTLATTWKPEWREGAMNLDGKGEGCLLRY